MKKYYPCFLCREDVEVKKTKKDKPYFVCNPCGMQVFIRGRAGIERMEELAKSGIKKDLNSLKNRAAELKKDILAIKSKNMPPDILNPLEIIISAFDAIEKELFGEKSHAPIP